MAILFEGTVTTKTGGRVKLIIDRIPDGRRPDIILADPDNPEPETVVKIQVRKPDGTWYKELEFVAEYLTLGELRRHFNIE